MKRVTKKSVELLKDNGFVASARDSGEFIRKVDDQIHGVYFHFDHVDLYVRVLFHYTFLESFNFTGEEAPSVPLSGFRSYDFVFQADVAEFERPVGRKSSWQRPFDDRGTKVLDWDTSFLESKTQFALNILQDASRKWQDPCAIMDVLTPETFEYRVHQLGCGIEDGQDFPVADWLFGPWSSEPLKLCCLAASIATRYGYGDILVPKYRLAYQEIIDTYVASGGGADSYMDLVRLRK